MTACNLPNSVVPQSKDIALAVARIALVAQKRTKERELKRDVIHEAVTSFDVVTSTEDVGIDDEFSEARAEKIYQVRHGSEALKQLEIEWSHASLWPTIETDLLMDESQMLTELYQLHFSSSQNELAAVDAVDNSTFTVLFNKIENFSLVFLLYTNVLLSYTWKSMT